MSKMGNMFSWLEKMDLDKETAAVVDKSKKLTEIELAQYVVVKLLPLKTDTDRLVLLLKDLKITDYDTEGEVWDKGLRYMKFFRELFRVPR